jgi:hypothetical protein
MSDQKLRKLTRTWKETGSSEDEAKLLLEQVRCGELSETQLRIAAHCQHPAACIGIKYQAFLPSNPEELKKWLNDLQMISEEATLRANLAAARYALQNAENDPGLQCLTSIVRESEKALLIQCEETANRVVEQANALNVLGAQPLGIRWTISAAAQAIGINICKGNTQTDDEIQRYTHIALSGISDAFGLHQTMPLICSEVIQWALNRSDPIQDHPTSSGRQD